MDYQKIYDSLIAKARARPPVGYSEKHHVKPRCLGGDDSKMNLVKMSARAHFVAHLLLAKIHGGKLVYAAWGMANHGRYTSRRYEWLRQMHSRNVSKSQKGRKLSGETKRKIVETRRKNGGYVVTEEMKAALKKAHTGKAYRKGMAVPPEVREAIRKALKGRTRPDISAGQRGEGNHFYGKSHSPESKEKMRLAQLGKKHPYKQRKPLSLEQRAQKSRDYLEKGYRPPKATGNQFNKGKIWVSNRTLDVNTLIHEHQLADYLANGFEPGRSKIKNRTENF